MSPTTQPQQFVIDVLQKKNNGYYVELGAFHSTQGSNTNILESEYDWKGVSFEIVPKLHEEFVANRKNPCILGDARKFDYLSYFKENDFPEQIDFLQIDIDEGYDKVGQPLDPYCSLQGFLAIPWNHYRFSVVTFEHDMTMWLKGDAQRDAVREIMYSYGYILAAQQPHEDWWIDPHAIDLQFAKNYFSFR